MTKCTLYIWRKLDWKHHNEAYDGTWRWVAAGQDKSITQGFYPSTTTKIRTATP